MTDDSAARAALRRQTLTGRQLPLGAEPDSDHDHLSDDVADLLAALLKHQVAFVVVGGTALDHLGFVRPSGDLDILFRPTPSNVQRLSTALDAFGAPPQLLDPVLLLTPNTVTQLGNSSHRFDLRNSLGDISVDDAFTRAIAITVGELTVPVLGRGTPDQQRRRRKRPRHSLRRRVLRALRPLRLVFLILAIAFLVKLAIDRGWISGDRGWSQTAPNASP